MLWSWHSPQDENGGSNYRPFSGIDAISVKSSLVAATPRWVVEGEPNIRPLCPAMGNDGPIRAELEGEFWGQRQDPSGQFSGLGHFE
jgi:hypothetical protein